MLNPLSTITRGHMQRLTVPSARVNSYLHSFLPTTTKLWNRLPEHLVEAQSLARTFQRTYFEHTLALIVFNQLANYLTVFDLLISVRLYTLYEVLHSNIVLCICTIHIMVLWLRVMIFVLWLFQMVNQYNYVTSYYTTMI